MRSPPGHGSALVAACLALLFASLGCLPDADPAGLSESHAPAIRDSVFSALEAFGEPGPDPAEACGFYSDSPAFRFYENGALRYKSAAGVRF